MFGRTARGRRAQGREGRERTKLTSIPFPSLCSLALPQEFFKKIKFKYLEQEAKETFLKLILAEDPVQIDREDNNRLGELEAPSSPPCLPSPPYSPRGATTLTIPTLFASCPARGGEQRVQSHPEGFEDRARCAQERGRSSR